MIASSSREQRSNSSREGHEESRGEELTRREGRGERCSDDETLMTDETQGIRFR
jgi:hypothetical protein